MEYLTETLKIANDHIQDLSSESKVATDNFPNPTVGIIIDEHYFRILKARTKRRDNFDALQKEVKALGYLESDYGDKLPINLDLKIDNGQPDANNIQPTIKDLSPTKYPPSKKTKTEICV
jgi:hypothetical protein